MKVLSLFNGISCGRVALERAGIEVERGVNFETDKYANQVAQRNYPNDEYNGDVETAYFKQYKGFDIVMGGFPCTDLSIAKNGRRGLQGEHSRLFWELVRAIIETKCKYFLVENNASMPKEDRAIITRTLGVEPIMINSALVSAQQRKRLYWTNIPGVTQPEDRGILLKDVLESGLAACELAYIDYEAHEDSDIVITNNSIRCQRKDKKHSTIQGTHVNFEHSKTQTISVSHAPKVFEPVYPVGESNGKSYCLTASYDGAVVQNALEKKQKTMIAEPVIYQRPHGYNKGGVKTDKSPTLTANGDWQDNNHICEPVHSKHGNQPIYLVADRRIEINGREYEINLPDGDYIIRKLTPVECERLQTLPDNFTAGISNTQRYKTIGNAWTVDVIAHILGFVPKE